MAEPTDEDFERVDRFAQWLERAAMIAEHPEQVNSYSINAAALRRVLEKARGR